ncbi:hypothetical protein RclHR1_02920001 [Rhizophagus clarus]|uniref:HAT C-terminal dimerisation domain-containing protein n=1 Tax=Rhizophagus clarus TaxID=94130 RepID=A0A2Z6RYF2_9GLOM|nr:hypothetical protein RclHR1_02920001 [Rhizophagus clarus]
MNIKINVLMILTNNCEDSEDNRHDTSTTSTTKSNKKRKTNDGTQSHIDDHYENFPTPLGKEDQINKALAKIFIKGGGLKSHTKTRWSTMWDCVSSIVRLELAFARVILSEHENDIKVRVKDILYDRNFYGIIASILHPLKVTVGCLESRTSTLTDCYIHLLSLAGAIYRMSNQNTQFKNYCIIKFNERFNEFSDDLFLLAFFLHPRYHGKGINPNKFRNITLKAAQIWKDMGHNQESYTPIIWWETAQNTKEEWELQTLALRLFAISPHSSASCERSFSVLGWFYGQRRTKLAADRVEGMCKLHTYYITNAKCELPYYAIDTSENSIREKMINTIVELSDELGVDDFDFLYDENIIDMVIDMSQTYNLDVASNIDLESQIFNMERREPENEVIVDQNRQTVVLAPECEDFDIEALIAKEMNDNEN